ncbi:MAG TPA: FG-GAP-like repeat-containing protein [Gaiellaceae bacterium]|nr:FG-GAP-like repeat-containing protein [Gaiellaceae bacterium]
MAEVVIRGVRYPVLLPKLRDPRLHLAATITSLQVIGQVGFHFRVSIAQILLAVGTAALLEVAIAFRAQRVVMWPASAMLTGNGVAFVLRVPGTEHGQWWSLRGWWIFVATAAVSLLSKHVVRWRGAHVFNPSNIGLVLCFLLLGRGRVDPLDFWWGPTSAWLGVALGVIVAGGLAILLRLGLLRVAVGFWAAFALGIGVVAAFGHTMTARWHLGPIGGFELWRILVTSPEVLVFLFFMITDPKTAPRSPRGRVTYALALGFLAAVLIAPTTSEFAAKVALLGSLAIVCVALPLLRGISVPLDRRIVLAGAPAVVAAFAVVVVLSGTAGASSFRVLPPGALPPITILPSRGVQTQLDRHTAELVAHDLLAVRPVRVDARLRVWLEPGAGQAPPVAVAQVSGRSYRLVSDGRRWRLQGKDGAFERLAYVPVLPGYRFTRVALPFRQGAFRYGVTNDPAAMMGGGLCWLDYNNDGWLDLFVVNSYGEGDIGAYSAHGGLPRTALYENVRGRFVDVTARSHAGRAVRGEGCVAADFDGDGRTDLFVTTAQSDELLWNNGDGTFTESTRSHGIVSFGWHAGAAVADVNGDGRPDLFVAGYTEANAPIAGSMDGYPTNHLGVRDLLFLNLGRRRFREVGRTAGIDRPPYDHSLGAVFTDVNGDGRPDLYVANDEDPNRLYVNVAGGPLGFHFVDRARADGVADANAGMGIAAQNRLLFVTNSRRQMHASYRQTSGARFAASRARLARNVTAGWGASWVDFDNSGRLGLAVANGSIPVTSLGKDAQRLQFLVDRGGRLVDAGVLQTLRVNGRGLAAADYDNDGRMDVAVNTIGGRLVLLHNASPSGHWLEVGFRRFSPGGRVTVDGVTREVQAGSSYLSSEDPRVHFGLGTATRVDVTVRYPNGETVRLRNVRADRIVTLP